LGAEWASNPVVRRDVSVGRLLESVGAQEYADRRDLLLDLLDIDLEWHMHQVSDGERRRVQILLGLVKPFEVLLLDEVGSLLSRYLSDVPFRIPFLTCQLLSTFLIHDR
jgi:CCR4-NOT complex subunit CAF16